MQSFSMIITTRMAWLYALLLVIAFAGGELVRIGGEMNQCTTPAPSSQETQP